MSLNGPEIQTVEEAFSSEPRFVHGWWVDFGNFFWLVKHWWMGIYNMIYPSVFYIDLASGEHSQFAIENGPVEIVDFPMNSMVDLSIAKC